MKRFALILSFTLLMTGLSFAQEKVPAETAQPGVKPAEALPAIEQILDKYITALGGKEVLMKFSSRASKGTFELPAMGANGTFENYEKAPNKTLTVIEIGGFGKIDEGFDGKTAWARDPMQGLREKSGAELALVKINAEFHGALKLKELFKKFEVKGKEKVGSADTYVVEATPPEGAPLKMYFDVATGLLVRQDVEADTPQGKMPTETLMEDYRLVDGVKLPFVIKTNTPAMGFVIRVEKYEHNVAVDDAKFVKPAAQ